MATPREIAPTSPTTSTGIWAMEDERWWPEGAPLRHEHGFGHRYETYQSVKGGWRFTGMTLTRLRRQLDLRHPGTGLRAPGR
jgi:hypothetical protein